MANYSDTIIYRIICNNPIITNCYVGHTTDFKIRNRHHKYNTTNSDSDKHNASVYQFIRENGGWDNWSMIQIETFPCETKKEAETREREWIEKLNADLNTITPTQTHEEWKEKNKDKIKEYKAEYYIKNKEAIDKKNMKNYEKTKEVRSEKMKEYYEEHKEDIIKKSAEYYEKNKLKISEKGKEKYTCECGSLVRLDGKSQHNRTAKHLAFVNTKL